MWCKCHLHLQVVVVVVVAAGAVPASNCAGVVAVPFAVALFPPLLNGLGSDGGLSLLC